MTNGAAPPSPPKSAATSPEQHPTDISEDAIAAMEGLRIDNEKQDQFNEVHQSTPPISPHQEHDELIDDDSFTPDTRGQWDRKENNHESYEQELQELQGGVGYSKGEPQACLFVASLCSARTDDQLQESVARHFEKWGTLLHVKVLKDWLQRPYSFVQFENIQDAQKAMTEAHNTILDNRHIRVEQAKVNRTLFIAKFQRNTSDRLLKEILERHGPVEELTILQNYATGKPKGCGFVKYKYREDAIRAYLNLRQNSKWVCEWASNLDKGTVTTDTFSVFVGQLNQNEVTEDLLYQKFGEYGTIESLQLINKTGSSPFMASGEVRPAFAFIKYKDEESARAAIRGEHGTEWIDRRIRVSLREVGEVRPRPHFPPYNMNMNSMFVAAAANRFGPPVFIPSTHNYLSSMPMPPVGYANPVSSPPPPQPLQVAPQYTMGDGIPMSPMMPSPMMGHWEVPPFIPPSPQLPPGMSHPRGMYMPEQVHYPYMPHMFAQPQPPPHIAMSRGRMSSSSGQLHSGIERHEFYRS